MACPGKRRYHGSVYESVLAADAAFWAARQAAIAAHAARVALELRPYCARCGRLIEEPRKYRRCRRCREACRVVYRRLAQHRHCVICGKAFATANRLRRCKACRKESRS